VRLQVVKSLIGNIELIQIVEIQIKAQLERLLPKAIPGELKKIPWLTYPYIDEEYSINGIVQSFIINMGKRVILIDTCVGADKNRPAHPTWCNMKNDFIGTLASVGINRDDVTDVLCTHMHVDHVGWNTILQDGAWVPTFPNARYYFAKEEFKYWKEHYGEKSEYQSMTDGNEVYADSILPIVHAGLATVVDDRADLGDGISLTPTPGHTLGHVSVVIETGADRLIVTGDCVHHPCQIARPEWAAIADHDKTLSTQTRRTLFCDAAENGTIIAGSHFSIPSLGRIVKDGAGEHCFVAVEPHVL
jgi:glyoxylase-like metal-dependent hydrolase (beta-lactamase superfamily II)